jgi:ribonuclease HI
MSSSSEVVAYVDGGSRGNPGPAAYGVAIKTPEGQPVTTFAKYLGETTNNFAEYQGLLAVLEYALSHGHARLRVLTDSELMARQISGQYKVRSPDLKILHDRAQAMISRLESFSIRHVYREQNREADRLANKAMDNAKRGNAPDPNGASASAPRSAAPVASPRLPVPDSPPKEVSKLSAAKPLCISATFHRGALHPHIELPLLDGEEVELEIRRRKQSSIKNRPEAES